MPSLIKIAIANNINNTPIAIKIILKILDIPKSLSGKLLCTVVVFVVVEELLVEEVLVEVFVLEEFVVEFELLDVLEVLEVLVVLDVLDVVFSLFVSLISISTAKTVVVKDNNINNIAIIENIFKFLIIFYTSIKNQKVYLKFSNMISRKTP